MADPPGQADEATTVDKSKEQKNGKETLGSSSDLPTQRSPSPPKPQIPKRVKTGPLASAPSSLAASPRTSRESSPTRANMSKLQQPATRLSRSRQNSQDQSPQRGPNTPFNMPDMPSSAAIQRALAAAGTNRLPSPINSEFAGDVQKSQKQGRPPPVSSRPNRLTSPSSNIVPSKPTTASPGKLDLEPPPTPSIIVNQATPKSASSFDDIQEEEEEGPLRSGVQSPVQAAINNNTLEAVQETEGPETPAIESGKRSPLSRSSSLTRPSANLDLNTDDGNLKGGLGSTGSGSESSGAKSANKDTMPEKPKELGKAPTSQPAAKQPSLPSRRSFAQLNPMKNKVTGEGSARNMTVETETVSSIPQVAIGAGMENRSGASKSDGAGSVRLKPSTETIRPKKEKKKTMRKAPSINSGTASSKADIFEAKIKNAVDEANSSDSEETFVYESNPPETLTRPQHRYHSRTPSMTSIASQGEHYRNRFRSEGNGTLTGKKSMKFANSAKNQSPYGSGDVDDASSTGTPLSGRPNLGNGSQQYPRHIGRHGRAPGHLSLFDDNAPFQNSNRSPRKANAGSFGRRSSPHPYSPRSPLLRSAKSAGGVPYDLEADDERTPLISSARTAPRGARRRGFLADDYYDEEREFGFWRNMGRCIILGSLVLLLTILVVIAIVLCSKPLEGVYVKEIANVLASDQEIIFDMKVHAMNPNLVAVQVTDLNILIHAKSKYVGTSKYWRDHSQMLDGVLRNDGDVSDASDDLDYKSYGGVDEGTDPIDDPHVMLLGSIFHFDAPLTFEASPFKRQYSSSVGEVRLNKPGNTSEAGGSDRWEAVIQHDFELIVRGIMKYSLPVSSHMRSVAISGRTLVHPEDPVEPEKPVDDPKRNQTADNEAGTW